MAKEADRKALGYEFRAALYNDDDFAEAGSLLDRNSWLLDYPVYGKSETAVHFFGTEDCVGIVKWLLEKGADPNGREKDDSPLHVSAQLGHLRICELLVAGGADLNQQDYGEETPLHKASSGGHAEIVKLLLKAGANSNIAEMCGELPIDQALPRKLEQVRAEFEAHKVRQTSE